MLLYWLLAAKYLYGCQAKKSKHSKVLVKFNALTLNFKKKWSPPQTFAQLFYRKPVISCFTVWQAQSSWISITPSVIVYIYNLGFQVSKEVATATANRQVVCVCVSLSLSLPKFNWLSWLMKNMIAKKWWCHLAFCWNCHLSWIFSARPVIILF